MPSKLGIDSITKCYAGASLFYMWIPDLILHPMAILGNTDTLANMSRLNSKLTAAY
jgi:hypothetical protein